MTQSLSTFASFDHLGRSRSASGRDELPGLNEFDSEIGGNGADMLDAAPVLLCGLQVLEHHR